VAAQRHRARDHTARSAEIDAERVAQPVAAGGGDLDRAVAAGRPDPPEVRDADEQAAAEATGEVVALLGPVDAVADGSSAGREVDAELVEEVTSTRG
jgi:hypothetical protein